MPRTNNVCILQSSRSLAQFPRCLPKALLCTFIEQFRHMPPWGKSCCVFVSLPNIHYSLKSGWLTEAAAQLSGLSKKHGVDSHLLPSGCLYVKPKSALNKYCIAGLYEAQHLAKLPHFEWLFASHTSDNVIKNSVPQSLNKQTLQAHLEH